LRGNWQRELEGAYLYRRLSTLTRDPDLRAALAGMADQETQHAALWSERVRAVAPDARAPRPDLRIHLTAWLGRLLGAEATLGLLINDEVSDIATYSEQARGSDDLATYRRVLSDETSHARELATLRRSQEGVEPWHRGAAAGGTLRDVVYGFNDGLTANFGLVMGVLGANLSTHLVLLAGFAGLLADSLSMASSGFLATRSEQEVRQHHLALERAELRWMPQEERQELVQHYLSLGLNQEEAARVADRLMQNPEAALTQLAREELGIDPQAPQDPLREGVVTGVATALGAVIPILPFLFLPSAAALWTGVALSMAAHFAVGASRAIFTGRPALRSGLEMFTVGMGVALIAYLLGLILGVRA
jgi:VIT1/CCC1 family predicted Fe2+/Mn2+ transporter/rubrerythrin